MGTRSILAAVAASLLIGSAGTALAQQSAALPGDAAAYKEAEDGKLMIPALNLTVDQMDDADLLGMDGTKIGEVDEVLTDASGQPAAVVVEVDDGIGDKEVIMGLDQLRPDGKNLVTNLSAEQVKGLPAWEK